MKKIAIVTLYGNENYGNKLQNFAVKQFIESNYSDYSVDTLVSKAYLKREIIQWCSNIPIIAKIIFPTDKYEKKKKRELKKFSSKYLSPHYFFSVKLLNYRYSYFLAGSDQIWNTNTARGKKVLFRLLSFAEPSKRVAVAASVGMDYIHEKCQESFREELPKFLKISTRERESLDLLESYAMKKCYCICDPTLALPKQQWDNLIRGEEHLYEDEYVLTYFLGDANVSQSRIYNEIKQYKIIELMSKNDIEVFASSPESFIANIARAKLVITDSFHACVFSLIYHVPFMVAHSSNRLHMENRLRCLLNDFGMNERWEENINVELLFKVDFETVDSIIEEERKKFADFIFRVIK